MENTVPEPRTIQPGEKVPAYLVIPVRQLRALLRYAEENYLQRRIPGREPVYQLADECVVLDLNVDTDQRIRAIDGSYQTELSEQSRRRYLAGLFCDPDIESSDRWSKPCASEEQLTAQARTADKDELCHLLATAWSHGRWRAETFNEKRMEEIMVRLGFWPPTQESCSSVGWSKPCASSGE